MANLSFGNFAGNFLTAFNQAKLVKQQREDDKKEREAKMKLFELQLKREQATAAAAAEQQDARKKIFDMVGGGAAPSVPGTPGINPTGTSPTEATQPSLTELLADPKNALLFLQSGLGNLGDINSMQGQASNQKLIESLMAGQGQGSAPGGMELTGVKLDSSGRPMIDLGRREVARWMTSPDGRMQIGVDRMGREITRIPAGPADRAPEDIPLTPDRLADFRTPDGKMLPPGTTLRQAQQIGAITAPKPAEADKKAQMFLKGMQDAETTINGLSGADTSSILNSALANYSPITKIFTSDEFKKYEAAGRRWAQNYLYLKSGAQASPQEIDTTFKTFFPQPGDSDAVRTQKSQARIQEALNVQSTYGVGGKSNKDPKAMTDDELIKALKGG